MGRGTIKTSKGQYDIGIRSDRLVYGAGETVNVSFYTHDLNNKPKSAAFQFKAIVLGDKDAPETVVFNKAVTTDAHGRGTLSFKAKKRGHIVLSARGVDSLDNIIRSKSSVWIAAAGKPVTYRGEGIEIVADKLSYRPGHRARFLVLSRVPDIPFLFTVEGGNLYHHKVHTFTGNACVIEFPLTDRHTPNIFIDASAIFKGRFYRRKRTIIIPPVHKLLNLSLKTDKEIYQPGDTVTAHVKVTDHQDRPVRAQLSLGVVDESIYAISPELAVVMQKFFYPRKRNNVRTNNSLTFNFYGYSQHLKPELASLEMRRETGVSSFKGSLSQKLRKNFKDTCFWVPTVTTTLAGTAQITFKLPDNATQWRLTARCVNDQTQLGSGVTKIISRKFLQLEIDPPQSFTEGDTLTLPLSLKNITDAPLKGSVTCLLDGAVFATTPPDMFDLPAKGTATLPITFKVTHNAAVTIRAAADGGKYKDGLQLTVPVTPYGVEKNINHTAIIAPADQTKHITFNLTPEAKQHFLTGRLYINSGIYRAILSSLNYLAQYPYGCMEQTMSSYLPDVILAGVLKKNSIQNPELKKRVDKYIAAGTAKLIGFQNQNGGWGWFNEEHADPYMTTYVMYGLTLTRTLGYPVNDTAYYRGTQHLNQLIARAPRLVSPDVRVFALYVLALGNNPAGSIIIDMFNNRQDLSPYASALLTLALHRVGKTTEARALANELAAKAIIDPDTQTAHWTGPVRYRSISHQEPITTTATVLRALNTAAPKNKNILPATLWLMQQKQGNRWNSTRDTAAVIMALSHHLGNTGLSENPDLTVKVRLNNAPWQTLDAKKLYSDKGESFVPLPRQHLKEGDNTIQLQKTGRMQLFTHLYISHFTRSHDTSTKDGPLYIKRRYLRVTKAQEGKLQTTHIDGSDGTQPINFKPGEEFLVELTIRTTQPYEYMVLEDYIPAGFQIISETRNYNFNNNYVQQRLLKPPSTYKEIRDNRMVFFFNEFINNTEIRLYYIMRAALKGTYNVNPAVIRSMYFPERRALSTRLDVKVNKGDQ